MEFKINSNIHKIVYAIFFMLILPSLLVLWAGQLDKMFFLPPLYYPVPGIILSAIGLLLMISGIICIYVYGRGLPMNIYPPKKFVTNGIYKFLSHPIYTGACIFSFGVSIIYGSSSGLWMISPLLILACTSLLFGYEIDDIEKRFGKTAYKPLFSLPDHRPGPISFWNIISAYIIVLIPWLILYQIVLLLGESSYTISTYLSFENAIPVVELTEIFYGMTYFYVILAPIAAKTQNNLRDFMVSGLIATGIGIFLHLTIPFVATAKPFVAEGFLGRMLELERLYDSNVAALPAFHVIWTLIASALYIKSYPSLKSMWIAIAIIISTSCLTTGMHSLLDVIGGLILFTFIYKRKVIWQVVQKNTERIANSWMEWNFDSVRVINHGFYAGLATIVGTVIVGLIIGNKNFPAIIITVFTILLSGSLWAQIIEGSAKLLRPFGYFGSVIGLFIGSFISQLLIGSDFFLVLSAFAIASPWIQAIGRIRCLIQGCCHGKISSQHFGIKYFHDRSRVCTISNLKNIYLFPTQLLSIISNIFIGIFIIKLYLSNVPLPFISGIYLILTGLTRFVEENYRGEPQTPFLSGLKLYQWTSIIIIILGSYLTTINYKNPILIFELNIEIIIIALLSGLISAFAMGIDFPKSNKRFSRLV